MASIAPTLARSGSKGEKVALQSPGDAIARGMGMVHQHFQLVPVMTVAENVILGAEVTQGRRLHR
jgi:ABC-type uncharacterized transport system ATPase subunit